MSSNEKIHKRDKINSKPLVKPASQRLNSVTPQTHVLSILQRVHQNPNSLTHLEVLQLQHTYGNQVVRQLLQDARPEAMGQRHLQGKIHTRILFKRQIQPREMVNTTRVISRLAVQKEDDKRLKESRAYIVIVGPEIESHGPTVLQDGANSLASKFDRSVIVNYKDALSGKFPVAHPTDIIYLVAHGDDPNMEVARGSSPGFGDQDAAKLARTLKNILGTLRKQGKFKGTNVLEGCHSAVPEYSGMKVTGPSMLGKLQEVLREQVKTFSKLIEDEAELSGYLGPSFDDTDNKSVYSSADVESPSLRKELGVGAKKILHGEESVDTRRWRTHSR